MYGLGHVVGKYRGWTWTCSQVGIERVIIESHKLPPISRLCIFTIVMYSTYTSAVYWKERKCLILERYNTFSLCRHGSFW